MTGPSPEPIFPAMLPIEQSCYWLARRPPRAATRLDGRHEADVAIVGAGLTGLWTALFLKELDPGLELAVVERDAAAHGASGRNAGLLSETIDHSHGLAIEHFGEAEARRLAHLGQRNLEELVRFLGERRIDCDYEPTGRLTVALTPAHHEMLDRDEVRAELDSPLYLGGTAVSRGGVLDTAKLVDGLREEAERSGVRVYERSPVSSIRAEGAGVSVDTPNGRLSARRVVLATSAYTHLLLPGVLRRFIPLFDYVLVSEPLTPASVRQSAGGGVRGDRRPRVLQLLPAHGRRPDPLGHQRGRLPPEKSGGPVVRSLAHPLRRLARQLPTSFPPRCAAWSFPMPGAARSARPRDSPRSSAAR